MFRTAVFLAASLVVIASAHTEEKPKEAVPAAGMAAPVALERMLHGEWQGGPCVGDYTFNADGTFVLQHFTPGLNTLTGTWSLRWEALPPTLLLTYKTSDFKKKDPTREEYQFAGKTAEVKLLQLDDQTFTCQHPGEQVPLRYERVPAQETAQEQEFAALQGTWVPLHYEERGEKGNAEFTRHIIKGDKVTVQVKGATVAEGKVVLDPTKNPKHLDFQLTSGQTHMIIYVRAGDHIIYCGNRDGTTRPAEFTSGTANGGEYLMAWKIER
jgi:uncharacterized protein (TIGR03067 family)